MKSLVTGASGYLGGSLARALAARGDDVHVFQRSKTPRLASIGITGHQGDLRDYESICQAARGAEVVFHNAAKVGVWGRLEDFAAINIQGTENVISACRAECVKRLVFTSSASVVFDGSDKEGADESTPYPDVPLSNYTGTKAEAEQRVLAAAGEDLATVSLRPHLVWGPADPQLVQRILVRARQGQLGVIGNGRNKIDTTYIDNAVAAHLLADENLHPGAACNGKAYFVTNGEPMPIRELLDGILASAEYPPISRSVSTRSAYGVAAVVEWMHRTFKMGGDPEITRFIVREFATSHWFDISAARRDIGFEPEISIEEGLKRLGAAFFPQRSPG
jgi:nucleoside-diphosphate-sugar epimerase